MRKFEEFWFRYFSTSTLYDDRYNWVRYVWYLVMLSPAVIAVIQDMSHRAYYIAFWIFLTLFGLFAILWLIVWFYHKWRINHENKI